MVDFKGQEAIIDRCNIGGGLQNDYIAGTVFVFGQEGLGTFTFDHATVPEDVVDDGLGASSRSPLEANIEPRLKITSSYVSSGRGSSANSEEGDDSGRGTDSDGAGRLRVHFLRAEAQHFLLEQG